MEKVHDLSKEYLNIQQNKSDLFSKPFCDSKDSDRILKLITAQIALLSRFKKVIITEESKTLLENLENNLKNQINILNIHHRVCRSFESLCGQELIYASKLYHMN